MQRIFAIGETVFDIIFKNGKPVAATPGGSMLNTAVSLGRLGVDIYFVSEYANDTVGDLIDSFLRENGVKTDYVSRSNDYQSSLALAFLDNNNNAEYSFYKQNPPKRLDIDFPQLTDSDIVIYGSFYGIEPQIYQRLKPFLEHAREKNALVIYDPNFRKAHLSKMKTYRPIIMQNFAHADIVKGSDEDFEYIFETKTAGDCWKKIKNLCEMLIYTANKNDVELIQHSTHDTYAVQRVTPVSAIGAGDTFNAGMIYSIVKQEISKNELNNLDKKQREKIVNCATEMARHVCLSYENYISREFAKELTR